LEARALGSRGRVCAAQGYDQEALTEYERALTLQGEVGDRQGEVATLVNVANACARIGFRERALSYYERSLAIASEQGDDDATARARACRALLYVQLGRLEDAQADLQASLAYIEGLRAGLIAEEDRISYFGWDKMDVYRQLVLLLAGRHPRRDTRLALEVVERSRSRAFLDRLAATGAGPGDTPRLDAVGQPVSWPQVRSLLGAA
jgi:tetratricopeptide (TPR) repeat protein